MYKIIIYIVHSIAIETLGDSYSAFSNSTSDITLGRKADKGSKKANISAETLIHLSSLTPLNYLEMTTIPSDDVIS